MRSARHIRALVLTTVIILAAACTPEAERQRGGGPGADIGNRGDQVQLHGDADPVERIYYNTPLEGEAVRRSGSAGAIDQGPD